MSLRTDMGPALQVSTTNACIPEENPIRRFANNKNPVYIHSHCITKQYFAQLTQRVVQRSISKDAEVICMLTQLTVSNYAIAERVELHFNTGMTALTGETGAGKSIVLDALGLAMGGRADAGALLSDDILDELHG